MAHITVVTEVHPQQLAVVQALSQNNVRVVTLVCGRRWGKTTLGAALALQAALAGGNAWYIAPTYKGQYQATMKLNQYVQHLSPHIRYRRALAEYQMPNGGRLVMRSVGDKAHLVGEGIDFVVADEAALYPDWVWYESLRPALLDTQGKALIISTPKGHNWFYTVYLRGLREGTAYRSFHYPSWGNPLVDEAEARALEDELSEQYYRQEILAEFIDDAGDVFHHVTEAISREAWREGPEEGHRYVIGVDWAQQRDFTVFSVLDIDTNTFVWFDRFNQIDYVLQSKRFLAAMEHWKPIAAVVEINSMGRPLYDYLHRYMSSTGMGHRLYPFTTTHTSKRDIIESLRLAFEQGDITIPPYQQAVTELQAYTFKRLSSGGFRYSAPAGFHDDCVMSMALAWSHLSGRNAQPMSVLANPFYS